MDYTGQRAVLTSKIWVTFCFKAFSHCTGSAHVLYAFERTVTTTRASGRDDMRVRVNSRISGGINRIRGTYTHTHKHTHAHKHITEKVSVQVRHEVRQVLELPMSFLYPIRLHNNLLQSLICFSPDPNWYLCVVRIPRKPRYGWFETSLINQICLRRLFTLRLVECFSVYLFLLC